MSLYSFCEMMTKDLGKGYDLLSAPYTAFYIIFVDEMCTVDVKKG